MAKEEKVEFEGEVVEALPNAMFKVKLDNGHEVLGHVAGKMRRFRIRILPGDRVRVELSPYDLDRARIVYRTGSGASHARCSGHLYRSRTSTCRSRAPERCGTSDARSTRHPALRNEPIACTLGLGVAA